MARVVVLPDDGQEPAVGGALMDERHVAPCHLEGESAVQLLERLAWAIEDADGARRGLFRPCRRARRALMLLPAREGPFD